MTPQVAGAFLFAAGAMMALNAMGIAAIFGMVIERMED